MKKLLLSIVLLLALACALSACASSKNDPVITVEDGYVTVNGVKTEYEVNTADKITVEDGYLVVNGVKTEYEVNTADKITVEGGYLVVNGVKTEHKIYCDPVISVIDGFVAVNGIKTEYEVKTADEVTVKDGYLVVNGETTAYKVYTDPVVSIIEGYLAVNGIKTEHKIYTDPVISVIDGYVAVNGVKTEYEVNTADEISVSDDNYLVVNGVKTQYSVVAFGCNHIWETVTTAPTCTAGGYDTMTCLLCDKRVKINETAKIDHTYASTYSTDKDYHWYKCIDCTATKDKALHTLDDEGVCTICQRPIASTPGIVYDISADGTYAEVIAYNGTATKVRVAEEYNGLPVRTIYSKAFYENRNITFVVIPDSVTSIGSYAFSSCSSLTSVVIGDSVTSIGEDAFKGCSRLTSIKYRGTSLQWNQVSKGYDWDYNTGSYTITYEYKGE